MKNTKPPSVLIIYTGGTIGMAYHPETGSLVPVNFEEISNQLPELKRFNYNLKAVSYSPPIDSSNVNPEIWVKIARTIEVNYESFDGFVILHGTDTMSFSASALSFMLENLGKPVIFTGSQLPISTLRTDGRENIISAIEIAAAKEKGRPAVPEVCIFFQNSLFRGNRTTKYNTEYFNAFRSENYPLLAETGIEIKFNQKAIIKAPGENEKLNVHKELDNNVAILKIFPGIKRDVLRSIFKTPGLKGLVMETYGSGNAPTYDWFIDEIRGAVEKGLIILNITQCIAGSVDMTKYETGIKLMEAGVLNGNNITCEAAVTKLMFLIGKGFTGKEIDLLIKKSIRGEIN